MLREIDRPEGPNGQDEAMTSKTAPKSGSKGTSKDTSGASHDSEVELVSRACAAIEAAEGERLALGGLARSLGTTPWTLSRLFRKVLGVTPTDFAEERRQRRFRQELRQGESVASATYGAGYGSSSRVYEDAARRFGMTPASYRKGGKGAAIAYAIASSPLGLLLVATTAKGVCFVAIGDEAEALEAEVQREFPAAERLERDDERLRPALDAVIAYLEGKVPHPSLPLDVRATAFQRRVWQELLAIPPGETRSYKEVAERLGLPQAPRAVGRACASNPVALLIPCHRVTRGDGELGGYRWGMDRKATLLTAEAERG